MGWLTRLLHRSREDPSVGSPAVLPPSVDPFSSLINDHLCPGCGSRYFHEGPHGGAAVNIMCAQCHRKYWYAPPFSPYEIFNDDKFYRATTITLSEL